MADSVPTENGHDGTPAMERARQRAKEVQSSALHVLSDTPGWVWAVVAGVILLMIGILAASRYRARHVEHG
jgi:hypothetical protein